MYAKITDALMRKGAKYEKEGNRIYIGEKGTFYINSGISDNIVRVNFQGAVIEREPYYMVFKLRYGITEKKITIPIECIESDNLKVYREKFHEYVIYELNLRNFQIGNEFYDRGKAVIIIDPPIKEKIMEYGKKAYQFYKEHPEEVKTAMKVGAMLLL